LAVVGQADIYRVTKPVIQVVLEAVVYLAEPEALLLHHLLGKATLVAVLLVLGLTLLVVAAVLVELVLQDQAQQQVMEVLHKLVLLLELQLITQGVAAAVFQTEAPLVLVVEPLQLLKKVAAGMETALLLGLEQVALGLPILAAVEVVVVKALLLTQHQSAVQVAPALLS
jgi:hypothetical protein